MGSTSSRDLAGHLEPAGPGQTPTLPPVPVQEVDLQSRPIHGEDGMAGIDRRGLMKGAISPGVASIVCQFLAKSMCSERSGLLMILVLMLIE